MLYSALERFGPPRLLGRSVSSVTINLSKILIYTSQRLNISKHYIGHLTFVWLIVLAWSCQTIYRWKCRYVLCSYAAICKLILQIEVLCGILPISRVSAVPSCIYYTAKLLPLERIFNLVHPSTKLAPVEDKRTWRGGRKTEVEGPNGDSTSPSWTAMDILTAYADAKGWVTAKAGRPDVHRAGNASKSVISSLLSCFMNF
jgi:hypothetical protein